VGIRTKKQFDYNSIVVSLYGFLEQFVEGLCRSYVSYINGVVPTYDELPPELLKNHVPLTLDLISKADLPRYSGTVSVSQLVDNLHSCLSNATGYRLNSDAFSQHTANFRAEVIQSLFGKIGIQNVAKQILERAAFQDYLRVAFPDRDPSTIEAVDAFFHLDDLAERRNEVAHGMPCQILSNGILLDYVSFFEAYGPALNEAVRSKALETEVKHLAIEVGAPIAVYNGNIVCLELRQTPVRVGDRLIARTANNSQPFLDGEIQQIQIDGVDCQKVAALPAVKVGLRVDFRAKDNQYFFLLAKPV
jgi:hypothetical protein